MSLAKWSLIVITWALVAVLSNGVLMATPAGAARREITSVRTPQAAMEAVGYHLEDTQTCCCNMPPWCS